MNSRYTIAAILAIFLLLTLSGAVQAYLYYGSDSKTIYIAQYVAKEDYRRLQNLVVVEIMFWQGGDERLFRNPTLFPQLSAVTLYFDDLDQVTKLEQMAPGVKDRYSFIQRPHVESLQNGCDEIVGNLAKFHSNLKMLSINRKLPISEATLNYLRKFGSLVDLSLCGPLGSPKSVSSFLPPNVKRLHLAATSSFTHNDESSRIEKLEKLTLSRLTLTHSLLKQLEGPRLRSIHLEDVDMSSDCFEDLESLRSLKEIYLVRTVVPDEILSKWRKHFLVRVETNTGWIAPRSENKSDYQSGTR